MVIRSIRSGRQQRCLIKRQTEEIQETVSSMVENHTYAEIAQWLATVGIESTEGQVKYFIRTYTTKTKRYTIQPVRTYREKLIAYIDEMLKCQSDTYTIRTLHMRGSSWTVVTARLHSAGLIHPLRQYTPIQWRIMATNDEFREWRDGEIEKTKQPRR